jgi:hypothetical protein
VGKAATRYEVLAEYAAANGYAKLKADSIQHWTRIGLLPKAEISHIAFQVRAIADPTHLGRQLISACHYRYDWSVRDLPLIGVNVWLDEFAVSEDLVRRGLAGLADAPNRLLKLMERRGELSANPSTRDLIDSAAVALVYERHLARFFSDGPRPREKDLAQGMAELIGQLVDEQGTAPPVHLAAVASLVGMNSAKFAMTFPSIAPRLAPDALKERIAHALPVELQRARLQARAELAEAAAAHPVVRADIVLAFLGIGDLAHSG